MLQKAAHEPVCFLAQVRVTVVIGEDGLVVLQKQHMDMHAAAGLVVNGLRHQSGGETVFPCHVVNDVFDHHGAVCHGLEIAQQGLDLKLAGAADFGMMILHRDTGFLNLHAHLAAAFVAEILRFCNVIVFLERNDIAGSFRCTVPVCLGSVHGKSDLVVLHGPCGLVEQIELKLRKDEHGIGDTGILHVLLGSSHDVTGILCQRTVFRIVDDHGVADHGQSLDIAERINGCGLQIGDVHHVALFHDGVTIVGGVKTDAVDHGILIKVTCGNGDMAELSVNIHDLEVHHLDVFFLDKVHDIPGCCCHIDTPHFISIKIRGHGVAPYCSYLLSYKKITSK